MATEKIKGVTHKVSKKKNGDVVVEHTKGTGKKAKKAGPTIDLTKHNKDIKTIKEGKIAVDTWHAAERMKKKGGK